jgi:rhomboid family protein
MFIPYKIEEERIYSSRPWVVYTIMAVCIVAYIYLYDYLPKFKRENIFFNFGCVPVDFKWWSPFTCTLLHGSAMHLIGNLYFFWIYGRTCEKTLGIWKFTLLYLVGAFFSVMAHVWTVPWLYQDVPTIGASGAISAVLGAFLVMFPKLKIRFLVLAFGRPLPSHGPAYFVLGSWFLIQLLYSLQVIGDSMSVAFWAHVAGFTVGALLGTIFVWLDSRIRQQPADDREKELLPAWEAFCSGEDPTPYLPMNDDDGLAFPARRRDPDSALLMAVMNMDHQAAFQAMMVEFRHARDDQDYARMLFYYYRLLRIYESDDLPGDLHLYGAIAASRLNFIGIAAYGFRQAALSGAVDSTERLIQGTINILEKFGEESGAAVLADRIIPQTSQTL